MTALTVLLVFVGLSIFSMSMLFVAAAFRDWIDPRANMDLPTAFAIVGVLCPVMWMLSVGLLYMAVLVVR